MYVTNRTEVSLERKAIMADLAALVAQRRALRWIAVISALLNAVSFLAGVGLALWYFGCI